MRGDEREEAVSRSMLNAQCSMLNASITNTSITNPQTQPTNLRESIVATTISSPLKEMSEVSETRKRKAEPTEEERPNDELDVAPEPAAIETNLPAPTTPATPAASTPSQPPPPTSKEDEADTNAYSKIRHCVVENNGTQDNLIRLIGLKNLFSKQLPKMPKDYIVRLVFDRRHKSLAILSDDPKVRGTDEEIVGGICYRAYHDMRFAEIAFCAVNQSQQVKVSKDHVAWS